VALRIVHRLRLQVGARQEMHAALACGTHFTVAAVVSIAKHERVGRDLASVKALRPVRVGHFHARRSELTWLEDNMHTPLRALRSGTAKHGAIDDLQVRA
jgi:hypothetical protein